MHHSSSGIGVAFAALIIFISSMPALPSRAASEDLGEWRITQRAGGRSYNTATGLVTDKGVSAAGLVSVTRNGGREMLRFWEDGASGPTTALDGEMLINGKSLAGKLRIRSVNLSRDGSLVFLTSSKGPDSKVELVQDGKVIHHWPRGTSISLLAFDKTALFFSRADSETGALRFLRFKRNELGEIDPLVADELGRIDDCALIAAKSVSASFLLQLLCNAQRGSDIYRLRPDHDVEAVATTDGDDLFAFGLGKPMPDAVPILSVTGSISARQLFHAISASLLSDLGEPGSLVGDDAGHQSWSQSYRTMALATLYSKTGHPAFAVLARTAMRNTLDRSNKRSRKDAVSGPGCGWASRIYARDRTTPITLMINQAMIAGSLIRACGRLGEACPATLRDRIDQTAICLADYYEPHFDAISGLYRIPYGISFRFDGLTAPWNWQMRFADLLAHAAEKAKSDVWGKRARSIKQQFLHTWRFGEKGALWRYWPDDFYAGWSDRDGVSSNMPSKDAELDPRFEDLNHADLSLMAFADDELPEAYRLPLRQRLEHLLAGDTVLARDMDGSGPRSPRWFPAAGWKVADSRLLEEHYAMLRPAAAGSSKHLAYAELYNPDAPFFLILALSECTSDLCIKVDEWDFESAGDYLRHSPLFKIERLSEAAVQNAKRGFASREE